MQIRDRIVDLRRVPANTLRPSPRNWRTHPRPQMDAIRGILAEVGFAGAELARELPDGSLELIDGHARAEICGSENVPVLVLDVTEDEAAKLIATYDPIGAMAEADKAKLEELLRQVEIENAALQGMLEALAVDSGLGPVLDILEGEIPAPPDEAVSKPGDLWILGDHRLLCGNSGNPEDVDRLLGGARVHLVNTDPPYNVKVEPRSNNAIAAGLSSFTATTSGVATRAQKAGHGGNPTASAPGKPKGKLRAKDRPLANDFVSDEAFGELLDAWFGNMARVLEPGRCLYIWGGYANVANYPPYLKKHGLYFSQAIIWDKQHPVLTRKDYMGAHEWCFYCWKEGAAHQFFGPNNATDLWHVKKINPQAMVHLTEKPVELAARAILYSSVKGENVLDLFGGSGSTLIAAEQMGRRAYVMELDPPYCDVIVQRWEGLSGKKARLEKTPE